MWFITDATPEAALFAGLKTGVTREEFECRLAKGTVAECLHRLPVKSGDAMFLPSGRLHAIGAGNVLFEVQQNSDTTYRVFDWNRVGLDGKARELHLPQSLASINFEDVEPRLIGSAYSLNPTYCVKFLVNDPLFRVDTCVVKRGQRFYMHSPTFQILGLVRGRVSISARDVALELVPGQFCLLPACLERVTVVAERRSEFLHIQPG